MRLIIGIGVRASRKPRKLGEPSAYPVNRSSLSRVVARRVLFPLFAKHARYGEVLGSTIGVLFATAEIASGFAKRPSSKAHSNTRQRSVGQDAQPSQPLLVTTIEKPQ